MGWWFARTTGKVGRSLQPGCKVGRRAITGVVRWVEAAPGNLQRTQRGFATLCASHVQPTTFTTLTLSLNTQPSLQF